MGYETAVYVLGTLERPTRQTSATLAGLGHRLEAREG